MSENSWVQEPGATPNRLQLTFVGQDHIKIEVTVEAETFKQGFDKLYCLADECRTLANGYDQITQVANFGSDPVTEQMSVPQHQITETIRVSANIKL